MTRITVVVGDITQQDTQAIVNAANSSLLGGDGVDGAIHRAAGSELLAECRALGGCEVGQAKLTKGYNLIAAYVIHTVGPQYGRENGREAELLAECYGACLQLAASHSVKSVSFPAISTGAYGYPRQEAAQIAVQTVRRFVSRDHTFDEIRFVLFTPAGKIIYDALLI